MLRTLDVTDTAQKIGAPKGATAIKANPNNTGVVWVGYDDTVADGDGYPLEASDQIVLDRNYDTGNLKQSFIWAISDQASGDKLHTLTLSD